MSLSVCSQTAHDALPGAMHAGSPIKTLIKTLYYQLVALLYGLCGYFARVTMVNSNWTKAHITRMWFASGAPTLVRHVSGSPTSGVAMSGLAHWILCTLNVTYETHRQARHMPNESLVMKVFSCTLWGYSIAMLWPCDIVVLALGMWCGCTGWALLIHVTCNQRVQQRVYC